MTAASTSHHVPVDSALSVAIVAQRPLYYRDGALPAADRPAHVRAGSSLATVPAGIAVVQDDANFIGLIDATTAQVDAVELPRGRDGARQFDDRRGNKRWKLDLEACFVVESTDCTRLVVLGSGSSPLRERIVVLEWRDSRGPQVRSLDSAPLFAALREAWGTVGASINVEGAVALDDDVIRLLSRGTGRVQAGRRAANATCDLERGALLEYLVGSGAGPPPLPTNVRLHDLGMLDGIALGFTDATRWRDTWLYSATAEDTADAVDDGPVAGSVIGIVGASGNGRWAVVMQADGRRFVGKIEGIVADPRKENRLLAVLDADDPEQPSVLCTLELRGPWHERGARV
jgi:hypothetical protein